MSEAGILVEHIGRIERNNDDRWVENLADRKRKEIQHADAHRGADRRSLDALTYQKLYGNLKYHAAQRLSQAYLDQWLSRHTPGRVVLDYCCGDGEIAIRSARAGAALTVGIDISRVAIESARRAAEARGLAGLTRFYQGDAEHTHLPDSSIDAVVCCGVLHHLDLSYAMPELRRVMKPGGRLIAIEALNYNPVFKLYRALTPSMRTEWEKAHILRMSDVRFASRFFELGEVRFWHLCSVLGTHARPVMGFLNSVDWVLTRIPGVQLMAWIFTFELMKPNRDT